MDKHNPYFMIGGPWYNTSICKKLHGKTIEEIIRNTRTGRYNIMCSNYAHEKQYPSSFDGGRRGGGNTLPSNSTTE